jgi:D-3-phosphoglycerate dehydrogenase
MKIAILDDYADIVRRLDCFKTLRGHEVRIFNDHVADLDALGARLQGVEARPLRERTPSRSPRLQR